MLKCCEFESQYTSNQFKFTNKSIDFDSVTDEIFDSDIESDTNTIIQTMLKSSNYNIDSSETNSTDHEIDSSETNLDNNIKNQYMNNLQNAEPILTEVQRYTLFPIQYGKIWDLYNKQRGAFWTPGEIDFSKDKADWKKLVENEKFFIKHILAFFAGSDGIVGLNIMNNFSKEVKIMEAQCVYCYQLAIESTHAEVYSMMIETYVDNPNEKNKLFNAIEKIPCIAKKAKWSLHWSNSANENSFAKRLVAFAIVEGLFFSGAFCSIYWLKERGIMPGLTKSNEWIARDERMHTEFACLLYSMIVNKLSQETIYAIMDEAVTIESEFITESLPVKLIGMNSVQMIQYIKYVADRLLEDLGYNKKYNVKNPFSFMNNIGLESRSNFFDERSSTYQKAYVSNGSRELEMLEDF